MTEINRNKCIILLQNIRESIERFLMKLSLEQMQGGPKGHHPRGRDRCICD